MKRPMTVSLALAAALIAALVAHLSPGLTAARFQEDTSNQPEVLLRASFDEGVMPVAPALIRLLRMTLEPGAMSNPHKHSGPEIGKVESGTVMVTVDGPALLLRATSDGTPTPAEEAPVNEEFRMRRDDIIIYLPGTTMAFRNAGDRPAKILTVVVFPTGHQHPPYCEGQGCQVVTGTITPEIFGEGVATQMPSGPTELVVERLRLRPGGPLPASPGPVMLTVYRGALEFSLESGSMQPWRQSNPGLQPEATPGTTFSLEEGDSAFFPLGVQEAQRSDRDAEVVLLRLTITSTGEEEPAATPAPDSAAVIEITGPQGAEPTATPTEEADEEATEEPAEPEEEEEPTPTPEEEEGLQPGDTVAVAADAVNLRAEPSTEADIVTVLTAGQTLTITGDSVEADGFIWWPVELADDPSITGFVAEDFIEEQ